MVNSKIQCCGVSKMLARWSSEAIYYFVKIKKTMSSIVNVLSGNEVLAGSSFVNKGWANLNNKSSFCK